MVALGLSPFESVRQGFFYYISLVENETAIFCEISDLVSGNNESSLCNCTIWMKSMTS